MEYSNIIKRFEKRRARGKYDTKDKETRAKNSLYSLKMKRKPTLAETMVEVFLIKNKIHFMSQKGFLKPYHRIVDFYLPKPLKIIIEVDGDYHKIGEINSKDTQKDKVWAQLGYKTIRITNQQILDGETEQILVF